MRFCFRIIILAGKAQVVVEWGAVSIQVFVGLAVAKWLGVPLPDRAVGVVGDEPWGVDLVGIDTIDTFGFDDANGGVAQVDGFLVEVSLRIVFAKDAVTGPGIKRGFVCVGVGFFDALVAGAAFLPPSSLIVHHPAGKHYLRCA